MLPMTSKTWSPTGPLITVARQSGSGGDELALRVAEAVGIPWYDREVLSAAAASAGVSLETIEQTEHATPLLARILESLGRGGVLEPGGMLILPPDVTFRSSADYRRLIRDVLLGIANRGSGVIIGHAGQVLLRDVPGVLKVLVHAPFTLRVSKVKATEGLSENMAKEQVAADDRDRANLFRSAYGVDFMDVGLYDLCINTAHLSLDGAVQMVIAAAKDLQGPTGPPPTRA